MNFKILVKNFFNIGTWIVLICFIVLGIFTLSSNINVFGKYRSFIILSGSMEPTIHIKDIIIINQDTQYYPGQAITFKTEGHIVTHRIVKVENNSGSETYITKGDANRSEDDGVVNQSDVLGRVVFVVPKIGQFVAFAQSPLGLILLVGFPLLGLIADMFVTQGNA